VGSIMSAIRDDIEHYETLCQRFGEHPHTAAAGGATDCYGPHAESLRARLDEYLALCRVYDEKPRHEISDHLAELRAREGQNKSATPSFCDEIAKIVVAELVADQGEDFSPDARLVAELERAVALAARESGMDDSQEITPQAREDFAQLATTNSADFGDLPEHRREVLRTMTEAFPKLVVAIDDAYHRLMEDEWPTEEPAVGAARAVLLALDARDALPQDGDARADLLRDVAASLMKDGLDKDLLSPEEAERLVQSAESWARGEPDTDVSATARRLSALFAPVPDVVADPSETIAEAVLSAIAGGAEVRSSDVTANELLVKISGSRWAHCSQTSVSVSRITLRLSHFRVTQLWDAARDAYLGKIATEVSGKVAR
jgi:hypothetical protein